MTDITPATPVLTEKQVLPPTSDSPADYTSGRSDTYPERESDDNSVDKEVIKTGQTLTDVQAAHEISEDSAQVAENKWRRHMAWKRLRYVVLPAFALLVLGWWIASIVVKDTRHRWIQSTILAWWIIGLVIFRFVPSSVVGRPIGKVWTTLISNPFFKLNRIARLAIGWLILLGLLFGSCYGFPLPEGTSYGQRTISVFGLLVLNCLYFVCSRNRKLIKWHTVVVGLIIQQAIAIFVLKSEAGLDLFQWIATAAADFLHQGGVAATFFFESSFSSYFFVGVLGAVVFFIAFVQMMFYLGAMTWVVRKFAWIFFRAMDVSGAEAVIAAASPFIGQGESACLVKPFVDLMTPSELHLAMTSGFSTISGSVLTGYILLGIPPSALITASVMSIPASIAISKIVYPEDDTPVTLGRIVVDRGDEDHESEANALHAFSNGAWFGLKVAGLILCNVLVVLALLYVVDGLLTWIGKAFTINALTLELIFQYIFYPLSWLMGVPKADCLLVSQLLGLKLFGNEFVAYSKLMTEINAGYPITARGRTIANFCLAGFANLGSLGIQIGVISGLAPSRAKIIATIAPSALIFGFLSTCQTATIAGMLT
ncbi:Concentrative Na-nucleoside cotransporter CNT1/CNT2 [Phaffia rhodozyma]|uniref:Concentrative Na-nucleoside cotransporter CNT1/CNT2 n=1 Tax=Phaffia rhodozyma TaxID=264483 RepID=A0A0F7SNI1_PHARH|nr:Concentrative Na-nucleoside cotransporter CNT1/CNT2 [Phaffia rhodozyma]